MKKYTRPELTAVEISLCDVILTSAETPAFNIEADKSAGQGNWLDAWNSLL